MENASKALIIAGSILITILIIAMGVKIFTATEGTTDQVEGTMQTMETATFNNKFLIYSGTQSGSKVKALANVVIAHNAKNPTKTVSFAGKTTGTDIISEISSVNSMQEYTVTISDNDSDGYVDAITFS